MFSKKDSFWCSNLCLTTPIPCRMICPDRWNLCSYWKWFERSRRSSRMTTRSRHWARGFLVWKYPPRLRFHLFCNRGRPVWYVSCHILLVLFIFLFRLNSLRLWFHRLNRLLLCWSIQFEPDLLNYITNHGWIKALFFVEDLFLKQVIRWSLSRLQRLRLIMT